MRSTTPIVSVALVTAFLWLLALAPACSKEEAPPEQTEPQSQAAASEPPAPPETPPAAQPTTPTESAPPAATPVPDKDTSAVTEKATPIPPKVEQAAVEPQSAPPPPEPVPAEEPRPPESSPAEPAEPTHAAVGSEKCKMCHKIQHESWSTSAHAKAAPPVGCETCHGNGADYVKMTVMKDPVQAKAAGLVLPDKAFCTAKCHKRATFTDDMLRKAHAHKAK